MDIGLSEQSTEQEKIVAQDESTAIRYTVQKETIDLDALRKEKEEAEKRLAEIPPEPTDEELLLWARNNYPIMDYSKEKEVLETRIAEIEAIEKEVA